MKIESFFGNIIPDKTAKKVDAKTPNFSFDSFMDKIENSQQQKLDKTNSTKANKVSSSNNKTKQPKEVVQKENINEQTEKNEIDKSQAKDKETEVSNEVDNKTIDNKSSVEEKISAENVNEETLQEDIIASIAEQLMMPVEFIKQILADLNIKATDLTDKANMLNLMKSAYGVNTQLELLNVPNIEQAIANINHVLETANKNVPSQIEVSKQNLNEAQKNAFTEIITNKQNLNIKTENTNANVEMNENATELEIPVDKVVPKQAEGNMQQSSSNNFTEENNPEFNYENLNENVTFNTVSTQNNTIVKTEASKLINTQDVVEQIVSKMKVEFKGDTTEIKMILKPESLGEVSLKVSTQNGIVIAQFVAESQRVKEIIEANFNQLRDILQEKGIDISSLSVSVGGESSNEAMDNFNREQNRSSRRINQIINSIENSEVSDDYEVPNEAEMSDNLVNYTV